MNELSAYFSPARVAEALGASESSLKRWCDQGLLEFSKTPGGHRKITLQSVMAYVRQEGLKLIRPELLNLPKLAVESTQNQDDPAHFARALVCGDFSTVRNTMLALYLDGRSVAEIGDEYIAPGFKQIGELWSKEALEIYQERRACEITLRVLHEILHYIPEPSEGAPLAIGGTLQGDNYQLPTTLIELTLRSLGWRAQSLGSNHPSKTLVAAAEELRPRLFWLSVSHVDSKGQVLAACEQLQATLSSHGGALAIGGQALDENLRKDLSYSGHCDRLRNIEKFASSLCPI